MSHPTCCCSVSLERCDRCDLLVDLEGFHLIAVARRECVLVLDIESCDRFAGCPGCGAIAQGHGRVVVEVIDAPWAGVPVRIRWHKRRWICRETTCQIATFIEQNHSVCAPGRVWGRGRSTGRLVNCASREPPLQDWLDNWQLRGIPCGPISSRALKPHLKSPIRRLTGCQPQCFCALVFQVLVVAVLWAFELEG